MESSVSQYKASNRIGETMSTYLTVDYPSSASMPEMSSFGTKVVRVPKWKRAFDVLCLLLLLPCTLPIIVMIVVVVKVGSKGPVLFKQERIGLLGRKYIIFKFRTMISGTCTTVHEEHVVDLIGSDKPMTKLDARGDTRLIPLGRLLRAAGLDELPQLINVLRGEMSLVGPRPCLPSEYERYLPWQKERFLTRPGLTGLWQVSGKNRTTFNEMIHLDIEYVRKLSLLLDLKIIVKTIPALIIEISDVARLATASRGWGSILRGWLLGRTFK